MLYLLKSDMTYINVRMEEQTKLVSRMYCTICISSDFCLAHFIVMLFVLLLP